MGIEFSNGGFLTTVQDLGRTGFQEAGVPASGVMDTRSCRIANLLVGNEPSEGVLEVTMMGPGITFTSDTVIAVTGANLGPRLNGTDLPMYRAVSVKKGDSMSFMGMKGGTRAYVAFAGGLDVPVIMGSKSTHLKSRLGGFCGRKLAAGDVIEFTAPKTTLSNMEKRETEPERFASNVTLRVVMGPQDDCFTEKGVETFLNQEYTLTNEADRMGLRFEGEIIEHVDSGDIITDGIGFGAVQVPSHGNPIIMMADHQTTGGYTKIASVISVDLPKAAQLMPGSKVRFEKVSIEEAQDLYIEEQHAMQELAERFNRVEKKNPLKEREAIALAAATAADRESFYTVIRKYRVTVDGEEFVVDLESRVQGLR